MLAKVCSMAGCAEEALVQVACVEFRQQVGDVIGSSHLVNGRAVRLSVRNQLQGVLMSSHEPPVRVS